MQNQWKAVFGDLAGVAVNTVNRFIRTSNVFEPSHFDDLMQVCAYKLPEAKARFDPAKKTKLETYMGTVFENALRDEERKSRAKKRGASLRTVSLDAPISSDRSSPALHEVTASRASYSDSDILLESAVAAALTKLSQRQQQVCILLMEGLTVMTLSNELGVHRDTVYEDLKRIREVFERHGLQEFLD